MVSPLNISFSKKNNKDITIKEKFKKNLKYLIFLVLSVLIIRYFPKNRITRFEITSIVLILTGTIVLLDSIYPSQKIMC